jgi:hypothetical protein
MRIDAPSVAGATTILVNSTSSALTITQTGTGNALTVEDSGSPDSTPFTVDNSGNVKSSGTLTGIGGLSGGTF